MYQHMSRQRLETHVSMIKVTLELNSYIHHVAANSHVSISSSLMLSQPQKEETVNDVDEVQKRQPDSRVRTNRSSPLYEPMVP